MYAYSWKRFDFSVENEGVSRGYIILRWNYIYDDISYNCKVIRREENPISYDKRNIERRITVEDVNY